MSKTGSPHAENEKAEKPGYMQADYGKNFVERSVEGN